MRGRLSWAVDWILVFLFAAVLIWPLFKAKYLNRWESIESTFIADARFLRDHWPHPNWQPNWYCGTRTDYVYPPALRYGSAVLAKYVPNMLPVRAYHLYIAFFYCFGIAAVYLLARYGTGSRAWAWLAAVATALVSPSYLFVRVIRDDAPFLMPYRLHVLLRYGEGPHMSSLAWLPLALLFSYRSFEKWRPGSIAAAALCSAMVVSNNFYGATSLAMLYPILLWSVFITHLDKGVWLRAAIIPVLTYGLTAFWLLPSYLTLTLDNMRFVASEGNAWSRWAALAAAVVLVVVSSRFVKGKRSLAWVTFLAGATAFFALNVLGNHYLGFLLIGVPGRLFPELDLILILLSMEILRRVWAPNRGGSTLRRATIAILVFTVLGTSVRYLMNAHAIFVRDPNPENRLEYRLQDWVARNMPTSRVMAAGSVRFWYNVWNDLPQLGGGSDQGILNGRVKPSQWQIFLDPDPVQSILWLQVLGVDAIIVHDKNSREIYHDYQHPGKFRGLLPVLHDNGAGDTIYGVPRRYRSLARVVDRRQHDALPVIPGNGELGALQAWYAVVENGPAAPTETRWEGTDVLHVRAAAGPGQSIWVQESFDPNWRAYAGAQRVSVREDNLGFMLIDVPPGEHQVRLEFPTPAANRVGRGVTALSLLCALSLLWLARPWRSAAGH